MCPSASTRRAHPPVADRLGPSRRFLARSESASRFRPLAYFYHSLNLCCLSRYHVTIHSLANSNTDFDVASRNQNHSHLVASTQVKRRPGYHGCGSIKGNREKFPKRKEKKRKRKDFLTYSTLSICKNFRKSPQNALIVIPLFHNTSDSERQNYVDFSAF